MDQQLASTLGYLGVVTGAVLATVLVSLVT